MSKLKVIEPFSKYITYVSGGKGLFIDDKIPFETYVEAVRVHGSI